MMSSTTDTSRNSLFADLSGSLSDARSLAAILERYGESFHPCESQAMGRALGALVDAANVAYNELEMTEPSPLKIVSAGGPTHD